MIGRTLGHYRVVAKLGAGGMGEVYRAHDTRLARDVALKLLPEAFAHDPARLARFEREARLLASLNHPNIAAIHGLEEAAGVRFLVLELVEGPTLAELLAEKTQLGRGAPHPLPLEEALALCRQVADALEAAHEKTIIHRDLKPANVKVTPAGQVKVLDFGLAKALEAEPAAADLSQSPTLSELASRTGVILGTAAYMSPEQARGKPLDKRTDIWSFGCVLYELLAGKRAFEEQTVSDTLAAVLRAEPDWDPLPADTPPMIRRLLRRCLQKDPTRRLHDIGDARIELDEALAEPATTIGAAIGAPQPTGWRRAIPWTLAGVTAVAIGVAVWSLTHAPSPAPRPVTRLVVALPPTEALALGMTSSSVALSPKGTRLVYTARRGGTTQLYLRPLDRLEATPVSGTEGASYPFFSPDGQWIGFFSGDKLKKVSVTGGAAQTLCGGAPDNRGASWGPDGTIFFTPTPRPDEGLFKVSATGGAPEVVTTPDPEKSEGSHRWPEVLPGGKAVLLTIEKPGSTSFDDARLAVVSLETGERRVLIEGGSHARYSPTGHIVYARAGTLLGVPFDLDRLEITGTPVPILEGVITELSTGAAQFALSGEGTLAYIPGGSETSQRSLQWLDRKGVTKPVTSDRQPYEEVRFSPDGRRLAVTIGAADTDIWLYDIGRGTLTRFTFEAADDYLPVWTPDGARVTFSSMKTGPANLYWKPIDGSSPAEQLQASDLDQFPGSWSPDGQVLAYWEQHPTNQTDIWLLPLEGDRTPRPFLRTPFDEEQPMFSPDGRWLAYASNESGRLEVYVQPFPGPGSKWQISTQGGQHPVWARNGKELYYLDRSNRLTAVTIETRPSFMANTPRLLSESPLGGTYLFRVYDVAPDGQRFLMIKSEQGSGPTQLHVVLNWFEELRRRVP